MYINMRFYYYIDTDSVEFLLLLLKVIYELFFAL